MPLISLNPTQSTAFQRQLTGKDLVESLAPRSADSPITSRVNGAVRADVGVGEPPKPPLQRWLMLAILSFDICVNYIPYYTFVPIMKQSMQLYGVNESALNKLCIVFAIVYIPGAFVTGPLVKRVGCKWTFVLGMAATVLGCTIRCGPGLVYALPAMLDPFPGPKVVTDSHGTELVLQPGNMDFSWLLVGQFLCAAGQPLLCNPTSEMGAEWFPPTERPAAAMLLNLMHFIGSSLSFVLPTLFVNEELTDNVAVLTSQVMHVLRFQLGLALLAFMMTLAVYQSRPRMPSHAIHRAPVSFVDEVRRIFRSFDFWIVNIQFALYVGVCHAFDAVEGSLLEHYGYKASLTSWTAVACAITSIVATVLEANVISSPTSYRKALVASNAFLAGSQLLGLVCLYFQCHRYVFVLAVGIMGLATPGWGCSCELGSEVCYPARESTVTSFLEAFSNLLGVFAIIIIQWFLDAGLGATVLLITTGVSSAAGGVLLLMSNRLRRMEAEEEAAAEVEDVDDDRKHVFAAHPPERASCRRLWGSVSMAAVVATAFSAGQLMLSPPAVQVPAMVQPSAVMPPVPVVEAAASQLLEAAASQLVQPLDAPASQLLEAPASQLLEAPASQLLEAPASQLQPGGPLAAPQEPSAALLAHVRPGELVTFLMKCSGGSKKKFYRSRKYLRLAGVSFETVECSSGTAQDIERAVEDGLVPASAAKGPGGFTRKGQSRDSALAAAITHLRVMRRVAAGNAKFVNIIHDTEVVGGSFQKHRAAILNQLPRDLDFVNLNARRPSGQRVKLQRKLQFRVFKITRGLSPRLNRWLSNYVVSQAGAKKILAIGSEYDSFGVWEDFDEFLLSRMHTALPAEAGGFLGFSVQMNAVSYHCREQSEKNSNCKI